MKLRQIIYIIFPILTLLCIIYFLYIRKYKFFENLEEPQQHAFVVLTRGYNEDEQYNTLIERNKSIYEVFYNKLDDENKMQYDIIIFHEGNINEQQQNYIQSKTPKLPLKFITVQFYDNKSINNELCPPTNLSDSFSNGYKNMCYFWSKDFFKYLKDYNYIIRVDEDCIVEELDINTINNYKYNDIMFSSPTYQDNDVDDVVVGMKKLFTNYLVEHNMEQKNALKMPYTNFMIVNVSYFNNNETVMDVLQTIEKSNCIFSNRWGDLPIWGYILSYFIDKRHFVEDLNIKYFHGSHNAKIN